MDLENWRLRVTELGRQTWEYLESKDNKDKEPQTFVEKYWLGIHDDKVR
jgi:hypothetical protein